ELSRMTRTATFQPQLPLLGDNPPAVPSPFIKPKQEEASKGGEPSQSPAKKQPLTLSTIWSLNMKLSTILPLEAVERFQAQPLICVATTKTGSRCKNSTKQTSNGKFVTELLKALSRLECSSDFG